MASRDQHIRDALAGVFATTPLWVHLSLDGELDAFDGRARFMAEWHLRAHGYLCCEVDPRATMRERWVWVRSMREADLWPEDRPYMTLDPERDPILRAIVARHAEAEAVRSAEVCHGRT